ncbi:WS/DGAT/MGAT family acyltransferase [Herbihabitans rhizosphaerae]|uniref:Diacylglycerol O-acyltransferase n=1 Tax=Herbihabitans rhizosphaerae TaxID=1872711 RepID=A0A4Q7KFJ0_9PSEU|nr:wax ester/triacylglycerol synthase family O-acyltransferase [Herbihabitans rhizosphaerae]RZS32673.1 WS/DGAT/MGAT family acyltransferase [Herbihabitans rhizosphaerae]
MPMMPVTDSMFLLAESREHPMHVGGLQLFELPDGAGPDWVNDTYRELLSQVDIRSLFRRRPRGPVSSLGQWSWTNDDELDLEYHVRLSALPTPGRVRELLELTSRWHGTLLDRHRPLWEAHMIEGLEGNRFASYTKVHHALLDGVSAMRLLERSLSTDPAADLSAPWTQPMRKGATEKPGADAPGRGLNMLRQALSDVASAPAAFVRAANQFFGDQAATLPFTAPKSMLNVPITGARRFAAQSWSLSRIKAVGKGAGATVNDIMLAMCAGALRQYMIDMNALPDTPLVSAVPVSLRQDDSASGNAVGLILCNLATTTEDPAQRLAEIKASMSRGKRVYDGMSQMQILAMSAIPMVPLALAPIPGALQIVPRGFNVLISNVPGPRQPLYFNGARLLGTYPVSIPYDGQALNITVTSYMDNLDFGLTGCRRSVPHLQRLLAHLETALADLEKAVLGPAG